MNVKDLRELIEDLPDEAEVMIVNVASDYVLSIEYLKLENWNGKPLVEIGVAY